MTEETKEKAGLIFKKIPAIMGEITAIGKGRKNTSQGYQFRGIDDVYNEIHTALAKNHVFTVPEILESTHEERRSKSQSILIYRILKIKYTFYAEDGSSVFAVVIGEGMDSGDKASNKAMSVAHKYALLQVFCIPTEETKDPENDTHELADLTNPQNNPFSKTSTQQGNKTEKMEYPKDIEFRTAEGKKVWVDKYGVLEYFKKMKELLGESVYYAVLEKHSYKKSNEIKRSEYQKVYNDMVEIWGADKGETPEEPFPGEPHETSPAVETPLTLAESTKLVNQLFSTLVDRFRVDPLAVAKELKAKANVINLNDMDPDQAFAAIKYLQYAVETIEKRGKKSEKK